MPEDLFELVLSRSPPPMSKARVLGNKLAERIQNQMEGRNPTNPGHFTQETPRNASDGQTKLRQPIK